MKEDSKFKQFLATKYFSLIVVIIIMLVVFYFLTDGVLLGVKNIRQIFNGMVTTSFFAIGSGMLILFGYLDLSAGAVGAFAGSIMVVLFNQFGVPIWLAIILGLLGACLCGWLNAFMVNKLHFEAFIATMAMASLTHGVSYNLVSGQGQVIQNGFLKWLGSAKIFGNLLPITLIIAIVVFVIYGVILAKTKFGRTVYLCGGNKQAARLAGLKPKLLSYVLFINGGFLVGICGILVTARVGTSYATSLDTYQFTGMTAAMLGGIAFGGGAGDMLGCFLGMLILSVFNNATALMGLDHNIATIFQGLLLVIALAIDAVSARRQAKSWVKKSLLENN
jgi:ribose/xylose/arabinose/galactoside ABC-type transport system permease subunit